MGLLKDYLAKLKREKELKKLQEEYEEISQDVSESKVFEREFAKEKRRIFLE